MFDRCVCVGRQQRSEGVFPPPVRLHSWYSETEDEEAASGAGSDTGLPPCAVLCRPLPDEISVNNLLDDVASWSDEPGAEDADPAPTPGQETEPAHRQTSDTASAAASPDRNSQVSSGRTTGERGCQGGVSANRVSWPPLNIP